MRKTKKKALSQPHRKQAPFVLRTSRAKAHKPLVNNDVYVFVNNQNLFWGLVNSRGDPGYRIDIGQLTLAAAKPSQGSTRRIASAFVAGVVPDDDTFWEIWKNHNFQVNRGFRGVDNRSKQDDAFLVRDMTKTVCRAEGPSTIVLVAGDADYMPPLQLAVEEGWRVEVLTIGRGVSISLELYVHEFRILDEGAIKLHR